MDFRKLVSRYKQFGGFRLVVEYAKIGALWPAAKAAWLFTVKGSWLKVGVFQCCKEMYSVVNREKVEPFLTERYAPIVQELKKFNVQGVQTNTYLSNDTNNASTGSATKKPIWFCWLQGVEQAPSIVKACYNSIKRNVPDKEIKVIDAKNWREYVELPEYIVKKWEKGRIPPALFSDLLRLELLIKYGGTWCDSTVLCTGVSGSKFQGSSVQEYLDADLFLFQYSKPGGKEISISNWFITARKNNEVLMVLREMLYAYWKDYDCTLDYYMFHLFFSVIAKEYPEEIAKMPYGYSPNSLVLLHHWGEKFDQKKWDKLTSQVSFHKLAFRVSDTVKNDKENYYNHILSLMG